MWSLRRFLEATPNLTTFLFDHSPPSPLSLLQPSFISSPFLPSFSPNPFGSPPKIHARSYNYTYTYSLSHMYMYTHTETQRRRDTDTQRHTQTHTDTHTHTHTHPHTHTHTHTHTWWALHTRSKSCLLRNLVTMSDPNVNETPLSFSPQP